MAPLRLYSLVFAALSLFLVIYTLQSSLPSRILAPVSEGLTTTPQSELPLLAPEELPAYHPPHPIYKPSPSTKPLPPVIDNFPFAETAQSRGDLPPIPSWNRPPSPHVPEKTPLLIGFTRNWRLLQQAVVGYITAGWPPEDIIVVENTGVMNSNKHGRLSLQNPFFLNHTRLQLLGVNVVITPTLFTFAQLQNFYLWTAIQHEWPHYFWSHMDVLALSYEDGLERNQPEPDSISQSSDEFKSLYVLAVETLRATISPNWKPEPGREYDNTHGPPENWRNKINQPPASEQLTNQRWAVRTFHYDHLALVQTKAYEEVGGWDTSIPFYMGDCDMHERLFMRGFKVTDAKAGHVYDVATALDDLIVLYRKRSSDGTIQKPSFIDINAILDREEQEEHEAAKAAQLERRIFTPSLGTSNTQKLWEDDMFNSSSFKDLLDVCDQMQTSKVSSKRGRNTWQARQKGGEGEPYHRDPQGFEDSINLNFEHSRAMYSEKWGHRDCDLINAGLGEKDAWRVEHDWD